MRLIIMAAAVAALAFASTAEAKSCKDAKGHFIKCAAPAAAPAKPAATAKAAPCKDAKGHFVKCGAAAAPAAAAAVPMNKPARAARTAKASGPRAAPKCKTGVPCGASCIPKGKVCHKS